MSDGMMIFVACPSAALAKASRLFSCSTALSAEASLSIFRPSADVYKRQGIHGIDEYIRYGGTMSLGGVHYNETSTFASKESADKYVDTAIARNIQHSLRCSQYEGHFRHLRDLYDKNELTSALNRVVEDINHRFTLEVLCLLYTSYLGECRAPSFFRFRQNLQLQKVPEPGHLIHTGRQLSPCLLYTSRCVEETGARYAAPLGRTSS